MTNREAALFTAAGARSAEHVLRAPGARTLVDHAEGFASANYISIRRAVAAVTDSSPPGRPVCSRSQISDRPSDTSMDTFGVSRIVKRHSFVTWKKECIQGSYLSPFCYDMPNYERVDEVRHHLPYGP
ncbi:hypothetical protein J6590_104107 [Homalodisca vitripennis]|nr:hypothetical protein J6590_093906 [Homalodisca vitripennis]KAG8313918.1 hypothetical protein J6590_104107 [Homalodisca vitripennis]